MKRGKFIVIEGLDGSGASTQIKLLAEFLSGMGQKTYVTKEPTDNVVGGVARGVLSGSVAFPPDGLQLLFAADRAHHLHKTIIPMLESGANVICDRYFWSSVAFGSVELDREWLWSLQKNFLFPDLSMFLQVSPKTCVERIVKNRFDLELFEDEKRLTSVWSTYEWLRAKFPEITLIVDGEQSKEQVAEAVRNIVKTRFSL